VFAVIDEKTGLTTDHPVDAHSQGFDTPNPCEDAVAAGEVVPHPA